MTSEWSGGNYGLSGWLKIKQKIWKLWFVSFSIKQGDVTISDVFQFTNWMFCVSLWFNFFFNSDNLLRVLFGPYIVWCLWSRYGRDLWVGCHPERKGLLSFFLDCNTNNCIVNTCESLNIFSVFWPFSFWNNNNEF